MPGSAPPKKERRKKKDTSDNQDENLMMMLALSTVLKAVDVDVTDFCVCVSPTVTFLKFVACVIEVTGNLLLSLFFFS